MNDKKTVYPGMPAPGTEGTQAMFVAPKKDAGKPILGFLYSVSRSAYGEYWPLYVGPNTIGRGDKNAVCLTESSVSDNHATLVIRRMQNNGANNGIFVFLQDTGSMFGTMLNGVTLDFNPKECHSGDIITIGANYELYLVLIDPEALGLKQKEEFKSVDPQPQMEAVNPPAFPQPPVGMNAGNAAKGTVPGNSATPFDGRKPTIYMPGKN